MRGHLQASQGLPGKILTGGYQRWGSAFYVFAVFDREVFTFTFACGRYVDPTTAIHGMNSAQL